MDVVRTYDRGVESSPTRSYVSPLRREQSRATRERIVGAARELMLERGYAATSMAEVADRAGVARPTLYAASSGGKPGLARLVYNVTLMGDADITPMNRRDAIRRLIDDPDQRVKLRGYGTLNARLWDRLAPVLRMLRDAAGSATVGRDELVQLLGDAERRRLGGAIECAQNVSAAGPLRSGMTVERAGQELFGLSSLDSFDNLTGLCGWTIDEYGSWLAERMIDAILPRARSQAS